MDTEIYQVMLEKNPLLGLIRTMTLFAAGKADFIRDDIGRNITLENIKAYSVFRRVAIWDAEKSIEPSGIFIMQYLPKKPNYAAEVGILKKALMIYVGFKGFRSKYWAVHFTGECLGVYEWDTYEDAVRFSRSIVIRAITRRCVKNSVSYMVLDRSKANRFLVIEP